CGRLMCCLRYEHEFYVLSRRKFPKEGKILTTSRGEEKVISCDIFHERVTLRTAEGDSRVLTLAELRSEVDGLDQPAEPVADTGTDDARASVADAHADPAVRAMLDTVEIEIASMMEMAPVVVAPVSMAPAAAAPVTAEPSIDIGVTETAAESAAEATRRKRRRGRRGGRRLRAAEERRQTDPTGSAPSGDGGDDDSDDTEE
ncbi:MAG: hypothetical protein P3C10_13765, partial [Gemmatimonadota bacterium]|nr:hypothetical protein [Gemmatimonadota bacterium]